MPYDGLAAWGPALATMGAFLCVKWLPPSDATRTAARVVRIGAAGLAGILMLRYLIWRIGALPPQQSWLQNAWAVTFLVMEVLNAVSGLIILLFMSRTLGRSAEADATQDLPLRAAPTDVLIPTYNEPKTVLERTIVCALDIDHPDLRVWVLDDHARPWVRELAEELGARYLSRSGGAHAKAGNINDGLKQILVTGRRPEFLLVLDADFVVSRHFLTLPWTLRNA